MNILVGSKNPVKLDSVKEAFALYFENVNVMGIDVDSNVSNQPVGNHTFEGAKNRAMALKQYSIINDIEADFYVGIEGGIIMQYDIWFACGCMCIMDTNENTGFGISPMFELPEQVSSKLLNGWELGHVMDEIMNEENTKQKGGAIGFFTNGIMNRKELYIEGLKVAVIPFLHKKMYFNKNN